MRKHVRLPALSLALAVCLSVAGCGDPRHPAALQGTLKLTDVRATGQRGAALDARWAQLKSLIVQSGYTLSLKEKGAATTSSRQGAGQSGSWQVNEGKLKLTMPLAISAANRGAPPGGAPPGKSEQVLPYRLESGGRTLICTASGNQVSMEMVFTRQ